MCGRQMGCGHACPRCGVCSGHLFNVLQTLNPICSRSMSAFLSCCGSGPSRASMAHLHVIDRYNLPLLPLSLACPATHAVTHALCRTCRTCWLLVGRLHPCPPQTSPAGSLCGRCHVLPCKPLIPHLKPSLCPLILLQPFKAAVVPAIPAPMNMRPGAAMRMTAATAWSSACSHATRSTATACTHAPSCALRTVDAACASRSLSSCHAATPPRVQLAGGVNWVWAFLAHANSGAGGRGRWRVVCVGQAFGRCARGADSSGLFVLAWQMKGVQGSCARAITGQASAFIDTSGHLPAHTCHTWCTVCSYLPHLCTVPQPLRARLHPLP